LFNLLYKDTTFFEYFVMFADKNYENESKWGEKKMKD